MTKDSESRKTDRIVVIICALVGLGLGGWAILQALGFADLFEPPRDQSARRGHELLEASRLKDGRTQDATASVVDPSPDLWNLAEADGRPRGFLTSTSLVFRRGPEGQDDAVIDMEKESPRLREELPNAWLRRYNLQFEYANVTELDPDRDLFSNLEEFTFGEILGREFNPIDPDSHPPLHYRLRYEKFDEAPYILKFTSAGSDTEFFLKHPRPDNPRRTDWSELASSIGEDRNNNQALDPGEDTNANGKLDGVQPFGRRDDEDRFIIRQVDKQNINDNGIQRVQYELTIEDLKRPEGHALRVFKIKEGSEINLPVHSATLAYAGTPGRPLVKKEFDTFTLPGAMGPSYTLIEATPQVAVIQTGDQKISIPIGQEPDPKAGAAPPAPQPAEDAADPPLPPEN